MSIPVSHKGYNSGPSTLKVSDDTSYDFYFESQERFFAILGLKHTKFFVFSHDVAGVLKDKC